MANQLIKGNNLMIFDNEGHSYAYATNHTLSVSTETSEVSTKDHGMYGAVEVTKYNWEITSENVFTVEDFGKLFDTYIEGSQLTIKFGLKAETDASKTVVDGDYEYWSSDTKDYYEGKAYITNLSANAPNGEVATYSLTLTGIGKLAHKKSA